MFQSLGTLLVRVRRGLREESTEAGVGENVRRCRGERT